MSAKEELLARLEARRGAWVSGGALSQELGVSRSALWKAVEALKREGYPLEAQAGKGYRLPAGAARLSAQGIALNLAAGIFTGSPWPGRWIPPTCGRRPWPLRERLKERWW